MNRVIKFRIWDTEKKEFINEFFGIILFDFILGNRAANERYVIQQFTGLQDKNGKEIYEGDIIYYNDTSDDDRGQVIFQNGFFKTEWQCDTYSKKHSLFDDCNREEGIKIIGNIFEGLDLIKEYYA